eukprot:NODE_3700_length_1998_cov_8.070551.p1 GENE.NODE_3700_length_1998_cov_8.070551~~NODE_3700_length_1998_cov_8.070551.p1  ORF type:complete len:597 (+),score=147.33 NODE_3700_length_1998_cov_8.070551:220-1791(+)
METYCLSPSHLNIIPSRHNLIFLEDESQYHCSPTYISAAPGMPTMSPSGRFAMPMLSPSKSPLSLDLVELDSDCDAIVDSSRDVGRQRLISTASQLSFSFVGKSEDDFGRRDAINMTRSEVIFNLVNVVVGAGVVSVPFAFRLSGYAAMILVLIALSVTSYTAKLIGQSLMLARRSPEASVVPPSARDYGFLAYLAFGQAGRVLIVVVTCFEIWAALVTILVMTGVNAKILFPSLSASASVVFSAVVGGLAIFIPIRIFAYVSLVSTFALVVGGLSIVASACMVENWALPYQVTRGASLHEMLSNAPQAMGIVIFCFAGHPCFPVFHECMRERKQWGCAINASFLVAFAFYGGLATFTYVVFGSNLEASVTTNVWSVAGTNALRKLCVAAFLLKLVLTLPVLFNACFTACSPPPVARRGDQSEWPLCRILKLLLFIGLSAGVGVLFANDLAAAAALTGCLFVMVTSVIFPVAVHLRLVRMHGSSKGLSWSSCFAHGAVVLFGIVAGISGTVQAVLPMLGLSVR